MTGHERSLRGERRGVETRSLIEERVCRVYVRKTTDTREVDMYTESVRERESFFWEILEFREENEKDRGQEETVLRVFSPTTSDRGKGVTSKGGTGGLWTENNSGKATLTKTTSRSNGGIKI